MEEASFLEKQMSFSKLKTGLIILGGPKFDCIEETQLLQIRNKQVPASVSGLLWIL